MGTISDGTLELISDKHGRTSVPSCVTFNQDGWLIGETALSLGVDHTYQVELQDICPLLGHKFSEPIVQETLKLLPFTVEEGANNTAAIVVPSKEKLQRYTVEEIVAMIID